MMNLRGSHSPCPGYDNHQPFLKLSRWLQLLSEKGMGEEAQAARGAGRKRERRTPRRRETRQTLVSAEPAAPATYSAIPHTPKHTFPHSYRRGRFWPVTTISFPACTSPSTKHVHSSVLPSLPTARMVEVGRGGELCRAEASDYSKLGPAISLSVFYR